MSGATLQTAAKKRRSASRLALACLAALLLSGCVVETPPDADTPAPPAHDGLFRSEVGTLIFYGDGQSVTVRLADDFAEAADLPKGECQGTYAFKFQNGAYRYDRAEMFELYLEDETYLFQNRWQETCETAICLASPLAAGETIRFEK